MEITNEQVNEALNTVLLADTLSRQREAIRQIIIDSYQDGLNEGLLNPDAYNPYCI